MMAERKGTEKRGFASMDQSKQRQIAAKGGAAVSRNKEHMAAIGKKGGEAVSGNRAHMAEIGRKGGEARGQNIQAKAKTDEKEQHKKS
jgi:hypothetical protein